MKLWYICDRREDGQPSHRFEFIVRAADEHEARRFAFEKARNLLSSHMAEIFLHDRTSLCEELSPHSGDEGVIVLDFPRNARW